jgi:hypothetical protein
MIGLPQQVAEASIKLEGAMVDAIGSGASGLG